MISVYRFAHREGRKSFNIPLTNFTSYLNSSVSKSIPCSQYNLSLAPCSANTNSINYVKKRLAKDSFSTLSKAKDENENFQNHSVQTNGNDHSSSTNGSFLSTSNKADQEREKTVDKSILNLSQISMRGTQHSCIDRSKRVQLILSIFSLMEQQSEKAHDFRFNKFGARLLVERHINTESSPPGDKHKGASKSSTETTQFEFPDSNHHQTPTNQDEYYNYIELLQRNRSQALRAKTTLNVQRALYGNCIIAAAKLGAWASSGSSAMLSEFVHSVVDCGNQALLLLGLRDSGFVADRKHPYGYGKSMYFWALVSALGTFWLGAGVSMRHSVEELMHPSLDEITWHVWGVLGLSLAIDGWVLYRTVSGVWETKPIDTSFYKHISNLRDPATLAVLLEDGAACLGIVIASAGICMTAATGSPIYDGLAGVGISTLLGTMGLILVRLNQRFLLGQAVDQEIISGIEKILLSRRSIDGVHSVQSQWTGPDTFSYKAEVDFDGTYLAAKLMPRYQKEFMKAEDTLDQDLYVLLSWYAEDIMRAVEREIRHIEAEVRKAYPGAEFIELEPDSKDADRFAIDDGMEAKLKKIEIEVLNRYLKSLYVGGISNQDNSQAGTEKTPEQYMDKLSDTEKTLRDMDSNLKHESFFQGTSDVDKRTSLGAKETCENSTEKEKDSTERKK